MHKHLFAAALLAALPMAALADEGMWQPHQLPKLADTLKAKGLELDPAKLTELTAWPMNAVISLGGCTASFVSPQGLVVTNHHCAYGTIQYNSTPEKNILRDGFLARNFGEELPAAPGSRVYVTVDVKDVTAEVNEAAGKTSGKARFDAIDTREKALVKACEADAGHKCDVYGFNGGLAYYLIKQLEIRDVRLVYNPPAATGKFGGDVDNWMWPRHTGDYSFYRAYVGKDGKPADYAKDNVPFTPPSYLKVAKQGLKAGDYVMVAGYPGRTNRYRLGNEVEFAIKDYLPYWKDIQNGMLDVIARQTKGRDKATIAYASLVASLNNYAKNTQGQLDAFGKSDILTRKKAEEAQLSEWFRSRGGKSGREFSENLKALKTAIAEEQASSDAHLVRSYLMRGSNMYLASYRLYRHAVEAAKPDAEREMGYQERDLPRIQQSLTAIDRRFDAEVERELLVYMLGEYAKLPAEQQNPALNAWFGIASGRFDAEAVRAKVKDMLAKTELTDPAKRLAWLGKSRAEFEASTDPFLKLAVAMFPAVLKAENEEKDLDGRLELLRSRYMAALIAKREAEGKPVYADANSTLRVTYGTVQGYPGNDAVRYEPFTTLNGLFEKETGVEPFIVPAPLKAAVNERRFGPYYDPAIGSVPVNFLSTVDTTGGNSGSPTLNARGELVGLLFDGNYQSINASWDYQTRQPRSIHVSMQYVLWLMQEVDHAENLLKEMGVR